MIPQYKNRFCQKIYTQTNVCDPIHFTPFAWTKMIVMLRFYWRFLSFFLFIRHIYIYIYCKKTTKMAKISADLIFSVVKLKKYYVSLFTIFLLFLWCPKMPKDAANALANRKVATSICLSDAFWLNFVREELSFACDVSGSPRLIAAFVWFCFAEWLLKS